MLLGRTSNNFVEQLFTHYQVSVKVLSHSQGKVKVRSAISVVMYVLYLLLGFW